MRIFCFGDSNTYGFDPRSYLGDRYPAQDRWVDCLAQQTGWEIINLGANGREIPHDPNLFRLLPKPAPVDVFLVMLGTNDLLQGTSSWEAAARMEAFLHQLLPCCKNILLVAPPPMKRGAWVPDDGLVAESVRLGEMYAKLAQKLHISFADASAWNIELTFDGVHFSEDGHHVFAEQIKNCCKKIISPLDSHLTS